jgi:hypothetical protein
LPPLRIKSCPLKNLSFSPCIKSMFIPPPENYVTPPPPKKSYVTCPLKNQPFSPLKIILFPPNAFLPLSNPLCLLWHPPLQSTLVHPSNKAALRGTHHSRVQGLPPSGTVFTI